MRHEAWAILFGISLMIYGLTGLLGDCSARAQRPLLPGQLTLARSYVAEAGWRSERDWAAMSHVHLRRALRTGRTLEAQVKAYCSVWSPKRLRDRRSKWARSLSPALAPPPGWPDHASWGVHRELFADALAFAGKFLRAPSLTADPCLGCAIGFRGPHDRPRAGEKRCACGKTLQVYYRVRR